MAREADKTVERKKRYDLEWLADISAKLSLVEIGLGAILHGLHVPSAGTFLSLNQGFFLCRASRESLKKNSTKLAPLYVSSIASVLKSLSPAGKKIGPMLSIWMQGALFNLGTLVLGRTTPGEILGMLLLSPWSFIQPAITYYFLYGDGILDAILFGIKKMETSFGIPEAYFFKAFLFILLAKMALSSLVPFVSRKRSALVENIPLLSREPRGSLSTWRGVARDLTRPLFLFSFGLFIVYLVFTESDNTEIVLKALRPLALGIVLFWISRSPWTGKVIAKLREKPRFHRFFALTDLTLSKMSRTPESAPKPYQDPRS